MDGDDTDDYSTGGQSFDGRIMVSAVVLLIFACIIVLLFHSYRRWFSRHHQAPRRRLSISSAAVIGAGEHDGLDFRAINSLPIFVCNIKSRGDGSGAEEGTPLDCAVCLSEFEDGETGRILPDCKHCFHVDCIDMWLMSHSVCPLCRSHVMAGPVKDPADPAAQIVLPDFAKGSNIGCSSSRTQQSMDPTENGSHPDPDIESGLKQPDRIISVKQGR